MYIRLRVTFYSSLAMKHVHHDAMFVYKDACTYVVENSCNLATESYKPLTFNELVLKVK